MTVIASTKGEAIPWFELLRWDCFGPDWRLPGGPRNDREMVFNPIDKWNGTR